MKWRQSCYLWQFSKTLNEYCLVYSYCTATKHLRKFCSISARTNFIQQSLSKLMTFSRLIFNNVSKSSTLYSGKSTYQSHPTSKIRSPNLALMPFHLIHQKTRLLLYYSCSHSFPASNPTAKDRTGIDLSSHASHQVRSDFSSNFRNLRCDCGKSPYCWWS